MSEVKVNKIGQNKLWHSSVRDSGDTITPAGATITNNGTQTGFKNRTVDWQTTIHSFTANGEGYFVDTNGGANS